MTQSDGPKATDQPLRMRLAVFCLLGSVALIVLSSCMAHEGPKINQIPFTTLDKGARSGVRERLLVVVTAQDQWDKLWRTHSQGQAPPAGDRYRVDFREEMVIAVFAGQKPTAGYGIEVRRIEEDVSANRLNIVVNDSRPDPGAITAQMLTEPYHIVKLRRILLPATFSSSGVAN